MWYVITYVSNHMVCLILCKLVRKIKEKLVYNATYKQIHIAKLVYNATYKQIHIMQHTWCVWFYFNQFALVSNATYKQIHIAKLQFFDLKCCISQSTTVSMLVEFF